MPELEPLDIDRSNFKSNNNAFICRALFYEKHVVTDFEPMFTLKAEDYVPTQGKVSGKHLYSLKKIYMTLALPDSEYDFAMYVFDSYEHWLTLKGSKWFAEYYDMWTLELEARTRAEAIRNIHQDSVSGSKSSVSSAKWLANSEWKQHKPKRGRPTNEEVQRQTKVDAAIQSSLDDDWDRISAGPVQ